MKSIQSHTCSLIIARAVAVLTLFAFMLAPASAQALEVEWVPEGNTPMYYCSWGTCANDPGWIGGGQWERSTPYHYKAHWVWNAPGMSQGAGLGTQAAPTQTPRGPAYTRCDCPASSK